MASRGFEFAYMLDGSNATPVIRDFTLGASALHKVGDLMLMQSDGYIDQVTSTTTEVTCIMQERLAAADVTGGTTRGKAAIITRNQVWRCSMDATTTAFVVGNTKTVDTVDANTVSASDSSGGAMTLVDTGTDDEGNVLAYVVFLDTTFGNT
jgi:hypothetical protein